MDYPRSVQYIFEYKKWWVGILLGLVCLIIPFIGFIVFTGYTSVMLLKFHETKEDKFFEFSFDDFTKYLKTGLWPCLGMIFITLIGIVAILLFLGGVTALVYFLRAEDSLPFIIPIFWLLYLPLVLALNFTMAPVCIGGAVGQSLGSALDAGFILDFIKKMWVEIILSLLFTWAVSMAAIIAGFFVFCIGVYLALPFTFLVQWHLYWQMYELYLKRPDPYQKQMT